MGSRPKALSRPSRDFLQGARGVPPRVRGKCGSHANASGRVGEGVWASSFCILLKALRDFQRAFKRLLELVKFFQELGREN